MTMSLKKKISTSTSVGCRNKYFTILGCVTCLMANGVFWYWGNMSVYCTSYFVSVLDSTSGIQSPWVYSFNVILWTLGVIASGSVSMRIGRRSTVLLGAFIFDTGIFCSYFAVQNSMAALTMTMGVATGIGTGFMDGSALQLAIDWSEERVGLFTCIIQGSISFGAFLVNQLITLYVNPKNLTPDFYLSPTTYFTQIEVLDNVPSMFVVVGCVTTCLHLIGCLMLKEKPASKEVDTVASNMSENTTLVHHNNEHGDKRHNLEIKDASPDNPVTEDNDTSTDTPLTKDKDTSSTETGNKKDFTCKEMLKTKSFYACWLAFFVCAMPFMLVGSYYKAFGQIWIKDDYFMTNIATFMSIANTVASTVLGMFFHIFGIKNFNVFTTASMGLVLFWYYFTAMLNQWLYFITVLAFVCLTGPMVASYTTTIALLFGKKHFTTNFGLLMTSQLCFNVVSPYLVGYMLTKLGWFALYTITGAIVSLSVIPTIFFIPNI